MMRFLLTSTFILLFASCALKTTRGLNQIPVTKEEVINPYFSGTSDYIYKAKIDVYGRYFGGILIIKKLGEDSHRVVFTTEFGTKIFDFLYEGNTFTTNFILEELNKKFIVNTLKEDFRIVISEKAKVQEQFLSNEKNIYKNTVDEKYNFYFFDKETNVLERIVNTSKHHEKVEFIIESDTMGIANKIQINHLKMRLIIDLDYLKKE